MEVTLAFSTLFLLFVCCCCAFQPYNPYGSSVPRMVSRSQPQLGLWMNRRSLGGHLLPLQSTSSDDDSAGAASTEGRAAVAAKELKSLLVQRITEFRELKERDGDLSIDFGVKGGELNQTSRAPQKVDFFSISKDVGDKAQEIVQVCDRLVEYCPILIPTEFLGDATQGDKAPLNGSWKSLFTTAADANFSKNSTRGAARVQNIVDGKKGTITNVIDFEPKPDGTEPVLKQLNVIIKAIPVSAKRVELQFRYAKAVLTRFLFWKVQWSLYIPVPGPFITRCLVFFSRIFRFGKVKKVPKGYFDLLYLDDELRVHRTGEDNLFVQSRDTWTAAKELLA